MYSLSEKDRLSIMSQSTLKTYPDGAIALEIEKMIAATLPPLPGLVRGLSADDRVKVFAAAVHQQREDFIEKNGDAF